MSDELPHDEELRSLYRKLPADEPRAEVDEAILSAARKLADAHASQRRRFLARAAWIVPLATAASVILTVSLTRLSPERADVEPSSLREAADSVADLQAAAPAEHEEVWPEESPSPAPPPVAAPPVAAPPVAAPPAVRAAPEAAAPEAAAPSEAAPSARATPDAAAPEAKAPAAQPGDDATEARRRAEMKRESDFANAYRAEPPSRRKAAKESQAKSAPADAMRSSDSAAAMAQEKPAEVGGAPPAAAAPASPPLAALADGDSGRVAGSSRSLAGARIATPEEAGQQEDRARAASSVWPFGLAPGLDAAEACRRLESALKSTCRFEGSEAVVSPKEVAVADRGEFVGRRITRVTLVAAGGVLVEIRLQVEGFTTEQVLVAPATAP